MKPFFSSNSFKKAFVFSIAMIISQLSFAQKNENDSLQIQKKLYFKGNVSITNNGFSVIPTFTLGKPATQAILALGGKKFSFEPELRFALEAKPWSFIFWFRYKLLKIKKFSLSIGAHPALNFRSENNLTNGLPNEVLVTRRFLAGELAPSFQLTKGIGISAYYLYAHGLDQGLTQNTQFIAFRNHFSQILITRKLYLQFNPQVFYLKMDNRDGFFFTSVLSLAKRDFPLSIASIMNKAIKTNIVSKDFDWNVSLVYSFNTQLTKQGKSF
jgi:hypothetical protein